MKKKIALALCTLGLAGGVAAPAEATTRYQGAWQAATNNCLRYTGCSSMYSLAGTGYDSRGCYQLHYAFHTSYYGWLTAWTGVYCAPPYT